MTFDTTTILLVLVAAGLLLMAFGLIARRKPPRVERRTGEDGDPYVASQERPYMKPPAARPQGAGVTDEVATAATDVASAVLDVSIARPPAGPADDLRLLKGVGPKFVARLGELGIIRFDQLAGLNSNEVAHLDERMGPFQGRIARDRVIEQADLLARGDVETFEERFGKLGS